MQNSVYPNDGRSFYQSMKNPVEKTKEQRLAEQERKVNLIKSAPVLQWVNDFLDKQIAEANSIDQIDLSKNIDEQSVAAQVLALRFTKRNLQAIKTKLDDEIANYTELQKGGDE